MGIFDIFRKREDPDTTVFTGVLDDLRTDTEKLKDYKAEEIASFGIVNWEEKPIDETRSFSIRDQNGSSTCVAQTLAKMLGIENYVENGRFVDLSASFIYQRRRNTTQGMVGVDSLKIASEHGSTFDILMPSQNMSEREVEAVEELPEDERLAVIYKAGGYVQLPFDIEKIAYTIQSTGKGVMTWFMFPRSEWLGVPKLSTAQYWWDMDRSKMVHHSVTAVDFILYKGERALVIEDSWGLDHGFDGRRIVTESFLKKRMSFCAYLLDLKNNEVPEDQIAVASSKGIDETMVFGETSEIVVLLQRFLSKCGDFPVDVEFTGFYGAITARAVYKWQTRHEVASKAELDSLQGRRVGQKTLDVMHRIYP